jgi:hypothetical protein
MSTGFKRDMLDQFYTSQTLAEECVSAFIKTVGPNTSTDLFIEPSAGTGVFSDILMTVCTNVVSYDIEPKKSYIIRDDFLQVDVSTITSAEKIHSIGNPPFGRQSCMVRRFIKKCCVFSDTVAFILPRSFKKPAFSKTFPVYFHKIYEADCPPHSFVVDDKTHRVPCVFQIWIKKDTPRSQDTVERPHGFQYVSKTQTPDLAIRRVGYTAGQCSIEYVTKSVQSHYFIKLDTLGTLGTLGVLDLFVEKVNAAVFETDNTVGPKSISKPELTKLLNSILSSPLS